MERNVARATKRASLAVQEFYRLLGEEQDQCGAGEEAGSQSGSLPLEMRLEVHTELGVVLGKLGDWWGALGSLPNALQSYSGSATHLAKAHTGRPEV